jgi:hypothetical protein
MITSHLLPNSSARHELFSHEANAAEQSSLVGVKRTLDCCGTAVPIIMRRREVEPPRNHQKARLQSTNERMRDSNRRKGRCSLCWSIGHRAKGAGFGYEVVTIYDAMLVDRRDVPEWQQELEIPCCLWLSSRRMIRNIFYDNGLKTSFPTKSRQTHGA